MVISHKAKFITVAPAVFCQPALPEICSVSVARLKAIVSLQSRPGEPSTARYRLQARMLWSADQSGYFWPALQALSRHNSTLMDGEVRMVPLVSLQSHQPTLGPV